MATPEDDFKKALTKFKNHLTPRELADCGFSSLVTLDDVQSTIRRIQAKQRTEKRLVNINRAKRFIEAMSGLGEIVKIYTDSHIFVAAIWGPMKFLLQVLSSVNSD
jgi:hypothetical protein